MKFILCILINIIVLLTFGNCVSAEINSYNEMPSDFRNKWEALLHYDNGISLIDPSSNFFLSRDGYIDPARELAATLDFFSQNELNKCLYPARYYLLTGKEVSNDCIDFNEYSDYVSTDKVSLVFASESVSSPVSSMGHIFLLLEGKNKLGVVKAHNAGFVADSGNDASLLFQFFTNSIVGEYMLSPYDDTIYQYVSNEDRSLWEYELDLTDNEKKWLFLHLYELKSHQIKYSFFTHNCANGINQVLAVSSNMLRFSNNSFYTTPVSYIKKVNFESNVVSNITVRPSVYEKHVLNKGNTIDPLLTPKTTRFSFSYNYNDENKEMFELGFLPVISDIKEDVNHKRMLNESKFLEVILRAKDSLVYVKEINLINILSLPNVLEEHPKVNFGLSLKGNVDSIHTSLYPDIHLGSGFSISDSFIRPFYKIDFGTHINHSGMNFYAINSVGTFITNDTLGRIYGNYSYVWASHNNYQNYKSFIELSYSKRAFDDFWLNLDYKKYQMTKDRSLDDVVIGLNYRVDF